MPSVFTSPVGSPTSALRAGALNEKKWQMLLDRIRDNNCTPFLGPETCFGSVPAASQIAKLWADEYGFPLEDSDDLPRVAQFVVHHVFDGDSDYVKDLLAKQLRGRLERPT